MRSGSTDRLREWLGQETATRAAGEDHRPVRDRGVIAAIGPDGPWAFYLTLGMVATVNPCGFAMLPAYLSYFLGLEGEDAAPRAGVGQAVRVACAVSAGFLAVFALAGVLVELTSLPVAQVFDEREVQVGRARTAECISTAIAERAERRH